MQEQSVSRSLHVVGIGASAGGLQALTSLFDNVAPDSGKAYVVVQHLSPNYKSFMAELLSTHTSMKVVQATHDMVLEKNTVYLNPPKKTITVQNGKFKIIDFTPRSGVLHLPIDTFFHSLGENYPDRCFGVILSGTGSDGSRGIGTIKKNGGIVMAQDSSAKFDGMPISAQATNFVDHVLSPKGIANMLDNYDLQRDSNANAVGALVAVPEEENILEVPQSDVVDILSLLKKETGTDFGFYKRASIIRRVERRMDIERVADVASYIDLLRAHPEEVKTLYKDLLIGVTSFFRDRKAFETLEQQVIPQIFENKKQDREIRVWVAGCSTGEEAYSIAILFQEYMEAIKLSYNVKIFATDLDQESIAFASQGVYPLEAEKSVPADRLERFFQKEDGCYQITERIRKMVVFAPHNITKDPPFINMDLITCRNMLIYLQHDVQYRVISLFHFALHKNGFLFLGPSETIGKLANLFEPVDQKWNIYQHGDVQKRIAYPSVGAARTAPVHKVTSPKTPSHQPATVSQKDLLNQVFVDEHMPPAVVIDEQNDIVSLHGPINRYLTLANGKPSNNIHKMFDSSISVAIVTAMRKLKKGSVEVVYENVKVKENDSDPSANVTLVIRPLSRKNMNYDNHVLVLIKDSPVDKVPPPFMDGDMFSNVSQHVIDLERELQMYQEKLQVTVEELETANEELQATNEELVAANEELQSTNEELHSVNEELLTVNTEYQMNIQQLTDVNNDMDNFLVSTQIGTVFLDQELRVRRFTPAITTEINLLEVDIGRPISHISHHLEYKTLLRDAQRVLNTGIPFDKEVQSETGRWYSLRMLPYLAEQVKHGVVLTLVDITTVKSMNAELLKLSYAIEQSPSIVVITDPRGKIEYVNPKYVARTGYEQSEVVGRRLRHLNLWRDSVVPYRDVLESISKYGKWAGELESRCKDGSVFWESVSISAVLNSDNEVIHYLKVAQDITDVKDAQELLRKSEMLSAVGELAAGIAHEIRNPLTSLMGFTQLIKSGTKNDAYLDIMQRELERIEMIVNELLLLSKPQALEIQNVDLLAILRDVIMILDTQALMNQVEIAFDCNLKQLMIDCVPNQIKQVFINLLKNAIEAMPNGGKIQVSLLAQDGKVLIIVKDEGSGIPEEKLTKLGEPFYTTKDKGTGLGLMVSFKIIEQHSGEIRFISKLDQGTTVKVTLPRKAG